MEIIHLQKTVQIQISTIWNRDIRHLQGPDRRESLAGAGYKQMGSHFSTETVNTTFYNTEHK